MLPIANRTSKNIQILKMKELKNFKGIKDYLKYLQMKKIEMVIDLLQINKSELNERTKKPEITEARRKIVYLSKVVFNIGGNYLAERLNLDKAYVCELTKSTFGICQVDKDYRFEIENLIEKLK